MAASYKIESTADEALPGAGNYPTTLSQAEYDKLQQAIRVIDVLWYLEESYDVLLQNAIELETEVARQAASQRANIAAFPDDADLEVRLLNRRLLNFLASVRALVDSGQSRLSSAGEPLKSRLGDFKAFLSEQFDATFSYRLMDALRNHTQHRAAAIHQTLTMIRTWRSESGESKQVLSVSPQIERDALISDDRVKSKTREEIAQNCDAMIDVMPHLNKYVLCLGTVVDKFRALNKSEYDDAVAIHTDLLKAHLTDEWAVIWVTPIDDPSRRETLFTGAHKLRRLTRIRLRNVARDPEEE